MSYILPTSMNTSSQISGDQSEEVDVQLTPEFETRTHVGAQQALLANEDLVIPDSINGLRKAVSAIHAVPMKAEHNHTLNTRRLFDACIVIAQLNLRQRGRQQIDRIRNERFSPLFETHITELARLAGIPGKNYERVYEDLNHLYEMDLRWNIVGEDADVMFDMRAHFLSTLGCGKGTKRGIVRFAMDPGVLSIILEPTHWATLSLQVMKGLGTSSSLALYQNTWRYVNTHAKVTAELPVTTWIQLLAGQSSYVKKDPTTGTEKVNYGDFKRRILMDAIDRVNDVKALSYTLVLKESFSGNRVSKLQFKFIAKKSETPQIPLAWPQDGLEAVFKLGFSEADVTKMSQDHSYQEVAESLVRIKESDTRLRAAGHPITSRKSYFTGILNNVATSAREDERESKRVEALAQTQDAIQNAKKTHERQVSGFAKHQAEVFSLRLFELDADQRNALFEEFTVSPEGIKGRMLIRHGWTPKNVGALSLFRAWLPVHHADVFDELLCNPEDRSRETWAQTSEA